MTVTEPLRACVPNGYSTPPSHHEATRLLWGSHAKVSKCQLLLRFGEQ